MILSASLAVMVFLPVECIFFLTKVPAVSSPDRLLTESEDGFVFHTNSRKCPHRTGKSGFRCTCQQRHENYRTPGIQSAAPENSLAAFELAAKSGTWGIGTDVWRTSDGEYVCMHDGSMDRMTNMGGNISGLTLNQISGAVIDHGSGIDTYPNQKVPTLREYLELCSQYGINAVLDIKFSDISSWTV